MEKGLLYRITNLSNNKIYIGITFRTLNERWIGHKSKAKQGDKRPLYQAIRKYGIDNFKIEIIKDNMPQEELGLLEKEYIERYNSRNRDYGYNLAEGGLINRGFKIPYYEIVERSKRMTGKGNPFYGKSHSEETKRKISESKKGISINKGAVCSIATRKKISESKKGISTATEHTKKLWKQSRSGKNNGSAKAVYMINKENNNIICKFDTMKDAIMWIVENTNTEMKILRSMTGSIVRVCKGKTKTAYGYKWRYVDEGLTTIPNGSTVEDKLPLEVQDTNITDVIT